MKQITKAKLLELIIDRLRKTEDKEHRYITINGITIYYTSYNIHSLKRVDVNDFYIDFARNNLYICTFYSFETKYIRLDNTMYEII